MERIRILAIDDNADNLIVLKALLSEAFPGVGLITAQSGQKGIELCRAEKPDVVLLDIVMPEMDGYQVCQILKTDDATRTIPVVMVTAARTDKMSRIRALEQGADAFLTKPLDEAEFTAQVRAMLRIKEAEDRKVDEKERLKKLVEERTRELELSQKETLKLLDNLKAENEVRRTAEAALQKSEEQLRGIFENLQDAYFRADLSGKFTIVSPSSVKVYGYNSSEEIIGQPAELLYANSQERTAMLTELRKTGRVEDYVCQGRKKDGSTIWVSMNVRLLHDDDGQIVGTEGVVRDINERKLAEEAMRVSEERFRHISSSISDISYSCRITPDGNSTIDWLYGATEKITGYTTGELFAMKCWGRLVIPEDFPTFKKCILEVIPGQSHVCQLRLKKKDGSIVWIEASSECAGDSSDANSAIIYGGLVDITEQKKADEALQESEYFFKESQRAAFVGSYRFNLLTDCWSASEVLMQIFGIDESHTRSLEGWLDIIHPDDMEMMKHYFIEDVIGKQQLFNKEYRIVRKSDGETRWVLGLGRLHFDANGNITEMMGTIQDITQRKITEGIIVINEERFKQVADCSGTWIWEVDVNGLYTYVNDFEETILGYTPEEVIGKKYFYDFFDPEVKENLKELASDAFSKKLSFRGFENPNIHKDGHSVILETFGFPILDASGNLLGYRGADKDITERRRAEESLRESEKKYRRMVDLLPDAIIIHAEGKIVFANAATFRLMGAISPDQILGKTALDFMHPDNRNQAITRIKKIYETGEPSGFAEEKFVTLNNEVINAEVIGIPISYLGKPAVQTILRDITERKLAEEKLKTSEERYRSIFENSTVGIYRTSPDGKILLANPTLVRMLGYNNFEELQKRDLEKDYYEPDYQRSDFRAQIEKLGEIIGLETAWNREDNSIIYVRESAKVFRDKEGRVLYYEGIVEDITQRRQTEELLRESSEFNQSLLQSIPFGMDIVDEEGNVLFQSENLKQIFGEKVLGQKCWELYRDDKTQCNDCTLNKGIGVGMTGTNESAGLLGGKIFEITHTGIMFKGKKAILEIFVDITERKKAEVELQKSYDLLNKLADQVPGVVYQYRLFPDGHSAFPYSSPGMYDIYEVTPEEVREDASPVFSRIHPDDYDFIVESILESARNQTVYHSEFRVILPQQGLRWRQCESKPELLEDGSTLWHGIINDITERKQVEAELIVAKGKAEDKEHELALKNNELIGRNQFIQTILDNLPIGVALNSVEDGTSTYMNKKFEEIYGWSSDEITTITTFFEHVYPDLSYRNKIIDRVMRDIQSGDPERMHWENLFVTRKDGSQRIVNAVNIPLIEQNTMVSTVTDITALHKTQTDLRFAKEKAEESDRLKSAFLANMSHEIRTPLNSIIGFSELMTDPDFDSDQHFEFARIISESGNNLLAIINDIMDISKIEAEQVHFEIKKMSVRKLLVNLHKEFSFNAQKRQLDLRLDLPEENDEILIETDENRLKQILVNFIGNAFKFTERGSIEIGVKPLSKYLQFHITDTGIGIPKEYHEHIFERFRQVESANSRKYGGNGLGLAISKSLIELLGGAVWVESEPGTGSSFYFLIPVLQDQNQEIAEPADKPKASAQ